MIAAPTWQQEERMKSGTCPRCQSTTVYRKEGHPAQREQITLTGGVISQGVAPTRYVCASCGYVELYIDSEEHLTVVREKWTKVAG
jgi:transposase-like protein